MYWDSEERTLHLLHSCIELRVPFAIDWAQVRLTLGITCPRHRRILKNKLGPFGRLLPYREWNEAETGFVSIWKKADADAAYERRASMFRPSITWGFGSTVPGEE